MSVLRISSVPQPIVSKITEIIAHRLLAALLLERSDKNNTKTKQRLLTHEAISQMIGTCRETVTRLLSEWNSNGWITIRGKRSKLIIRNKAALEQLTGAFPKGTKAA